MSQNIRIPVRQLFLCDNSSSDRIINIMVDISNLVRQSHNLALQRFRHSGCRMIHHTVSDFFRQVQPLSVLLQNFYNTNTLYVMLKSLRTYLIQNRFTGMPKRCMPQIVPQCNRFRQIFIES